MHHLFAKLDARSPVPLYHQARLQLETWMQSHAPNDPLPTETELGRVFGVSRVTIRQALAEMIDDGILHRRRSRGRLYAVAPRVHQQLTRLRGFFTEDLLTAGIQPSTQLLSTTETRGGYAAELLRLPPTTRIFRIERLHEGDGTPLALQISFIPQAICPDLPGQDLSRSLFRIVEEMHGQPIVRAVQSMKARHATRREADVFGIGRQDCVIEVERTSYAADGAPVEYFVCSLRGDRYDFSMELELDTQTVPGQIAWGDSGALAYSR